MPLYEYECETCAHRFEVIQKFSDAKISVCPKCGGPVQKLLSSPAIQFKGSGFYLTDYGRGTGSKSDSPGAKDGKSEAGGKSGSESSGGSKTESKGDGKSEGKSESKSGSSKGDSASSSAPKASTTDTSSGKSTPAKND